MKKEKPKFYAFYKDFNSGNIETIDVLQGVFNEILTERGAISKKHFCIYDKKTYERIPVTTKEYGLSKAARPFNSRLDKSKLVKNGFTPLPTWQDALSRYLKEIG